MTESKFPISRGAIAVAIIVAVGLAMLAAYFVVPRLYSVSTNDAYVQGHLTTVTAKIPAYVQALHIDDNATVKAGQSLLELDARDYLVQVDAARATLAAAKAKRKEAEQRIRIADANTLQARAELQVVQASTVLATTDLQRLRSVSDQRAISSERLDAAKASADGAHGNLVAAQTKIDAAQAAAELARAELVTADAAIAQAQAALAQAQLNLSYTRITAPDTGTIANKSVEAGNYVQPGQMLLSIVPETLYVIANFKETQVARIKPGLPVIVRVDAYPDLRLKAHVDSLQRGTGSEFALLPPENASGNFVKVVQRIPVKIVFDDPRDARQWISPGLSVEATVQVAR